MKVLVLGDGINLDDGAMQLAQAGHEVSVFSDCGEAISVLREGRHFDAALIDYAISKKLVADHAIGVGKMHADKTDLNFHIGVMLALSGIKRVVIFDDSGRCAFPTASFIDQVGHNGMNVCMSKIHFIYTSKLTDGGAREWTTAIGRLVN